MEVTGASIRVRILKDHCLYSRIDLISSYRGIDPCEDTERQQIVVVRLWAVVLQGHRSV